MAEAFTVSEINEFLKISFDESKILRDIYVKGEISNFTDHYKTGHYYFTIKDDSSALRAVMFRMYTQMIDFVPRNGMKIIAHGKIDVFVRDGTYSLKVDNIIPEGLGKLYLSFENLKNKLEKEGLFDSEHKVAIPDYPQKVGVLTSATGAVIEDIRNVSSRRYPFCEIVLHPCAVQGSEAVKQLIDGLRYFEQTDVDAVIIARGGGSLEDLMPFNDEKLAREIYNCKKPIVSAVGHETDYTICDFVSDLRAPTPSAAAELVMPSMEEIESEIEHLETELSMSVARIITQKASQLEKLSHHYVFSKPFAAFEQTEKSLMLLKERLNLRMAERIADKQALLDRIFIHDRIARVLEHNERKLAQLSAKADALSPLAVLSRGYSVVFKDGIAVNDVKSLHENDAVDIRLKNGHALAEVKSIEQTEL